MIKVDKAELELTGNGLDLMVEYTYLTGTLMQKGLLDAKLLHKLIDQIANSVIPDILDDEASINIEDELDDTESVTDEYNPDLVIKTND